MAETIGSPAADGLRAALVRLGRRLFGGEAQWCPGVGMEVRAADTRDGLTVCGSCEQTVPTGRGSMVRVRIIGEHPA